MTGKQKNKDAPNIGLGVMSADVTNCSTSAIQQHRSRGTDWPEL